MLAAKLRERKEEGFTLIELLIVIIILGILATVVVLSINAIQDRGQQNACKTEGKQIKTAQAAYYSDFDVYASDFVVLTADGNSASTEAFLDGDPTDLVKRWAMDTNTTASSWSADSTGKCDDVDDIP
jgi:general secretion pathway protein G